MKDIINQMIGLILDFIVKNKKNKKSNNNIIVK